MKNPLSEKYDTPDLMAKIMGPNPIKLEEELLTVYFKPCRKGDEGAKALRVAEIASRLARWGNIPYSIDTRKLGTLLKKYRFEQVRKGEDGARYYLVIELDSQQIESNHKLNAL